MCLLLCLESRLSLCMKWLWKNFCKTAGIKNSCKTAGIIFVKMSGNPVHNSAEIENWCFLMISKILKESRKTSLFLICLSVWCLVKAILFTLSETLS